MSNTELQMGSREWGLLVLLSIIWGSSFFFIKVLGAELPPFTVVLGRVALAALTLNLLVWLRGGGLPRKLSIWREFLVLGFLNNILPFTLIVWGETRISSGMASILNATTPMFAVLAAHLLTRHEKLSFNKLAGVCFGLAGVSVLVGPGVLFGASRGDLAGQFGCLTAALSYSLAGIYGRRFRALPPLEVAAGQLTASSLILIPTAALVDHPWTLAAPSAHAWTALLALALLCTAVAYVIYFRILAAAGATNLMLVTFLLPISALCLGALFLDERITPAALGGMALIGLGLAAIDGRLPALLWSGRKQQRVGGD